MRGPLLCGFQSSSARTPARPTTTLTTLTTTTNGIAMRRATTRAWTNACSAPRRHRCGRGYDDASYSSSLRVVGKCVLPKAFVQGGKDAAATFEGQESIDVTQEETAGKRPSGKPVRSPPFNREVYSSSKVCDRACNLGRCCAFPVCKRKRFCWLTESRNRSRC